MEHVMTKFYVLAETEITAPQAGPVRIESARGTRPDNPPTLLSRDQEQTTSAHAV